MILEKQTEATIIEQGQSKDSIGMSLDLDSAQILMQMLSKNLYSDDIGSTIRECASNALDSHRKAGVHMPILVSLKANENYTYDFTVEDFGVGLDADDVRNIISKYGKSTKRNSATELGMMGLGFKSPLAYSSSFYFICRKDGVERKYMMYEGEDTNTIDLLYEQSTQESNGVKIIIPVKSNDVWSFQKKIKEQLCYFEDVYFDVPNDPSITNGFVIARHEHFQFSELSTDTKMHICLDNVYYPIDYSKLGISSIDFPIALRFSLSDGLYPTPNRESLRYTKEAKDIILNKLKTVANYFVEKYNNSVASGNDIKALINQLENSSNYITLSNGITKDITPFSKFATIVLENPKFDGITLFDVKQLYKHTKDYLLGDFTQKFMLRGQRMVNCDKAYTWSYRPPMIASGESLCYVYSDNLTQMKKDYMRSTCDQSKHVFFVKPKLPMKLGINSKYDINTYYYLLQLDKYSKFEWRERIKEYQLFKNSLIKDFINLDEIVVPQTYIDSKKKAKVASVAINGPRRSKLQGEIQGREAVPLLRYNQGKNCKFESAIYKLEDIHKFKGMTIYTDHSRAEEIDVLYGVVYNHKTTRLVTFSPREMKIVNELNIHNLISLDKFMEGKTKPFKRIVTSHLINKLMRSYPNVFSSIDTINHASKDFAIRLNTLKDYRSKYIISSSSEELYTEMLSVAEKYNLFDPEIYSEYLEMKELLLKLSFLNPLMRKVGYAHKEDDVINVIADLFKYYKHRVNLDRYNIKINEEVFIEENVEQLID